MYFKKYLRGGGLSRSKAREILHDKTAHGKPLTEKQRKFFGAVASGYAKFDEGSLVKAQEGLNVLPQHQQMYTQELANKRKWLQGRLLHENPKIREDAQTALDLIGKFPETVPSDMVEYKPYFNLFLKGALGRFDPYRNKIELADPNKLFPEKLPIGSKRFKEDTEDRKNLERAFKLSQGPYVERHEWEHLTDFPILENIIKKQNKDIYKQYVPLKDYYNLHKKDFVNPNPRGALNDATTDYYWATGIPSFKQIGVSNAKHMNNAEMFRALNDARRIFGIDPSRNSNPEEWQNIFEKSRQKLFDKNISEEERMQYNHILELFRTRGNDINKVNDLNNMIVLNDKSLSSNFMRDGGEIEDDREEENDDKEMVEGIADILRQVKSMSNRRQIAKNMMDDFEEEDVEYNAGKFLSMARIMRRGGIPKFQKAGIFGDPNSKTHYIFAEKLDGDGEKEPFLQEANDLQSVIKKYYPNDKVELVYGYEDGQTNFKKKIKDVTDKMNPANSYAYILGHHGRKYAGIPVDDWANMLRGKYENCFLGSCISSDLVTGKRDSIEGEIMGEQPVTYTDRAPFGALKNLYYRPASIWLGVNPNFKFDPKKDRLENILSSFYGTTGVKQNLPTKQQILDFDNKYRDLGIKTWEKLQNNQEYKNLRNEEDKLLKILDNDRYVIISQSTIPKLSQEEIDKITKQIRNIEKKRLAIQDRIYEDFNRIQASRPSPYSNSPYIISTPRKGIEYELSNPSNFDINIYDTKKAISPFYKFQKGGGIPERYKNMGFTKVGVKKESSRPGKKWMVLAKKGEDYKVVHGGYEGMKDYTQHGSEERRKRFWDRMGGKNSSKAKDPFSPLYWHKRFGTWQLGGTTYDMLFLQKENLLNQSKFSKFARGGMTAIQAYNFLFEDDDDDMYGGNNAPDINEVNKLKDENKNLAASLEAQNELNERLTGQLRRSRYNAAAMDEVNRPFVYNEGSTNYGMITDNPEFWNTENENFVRESFNNDFGSLFAPGTNAPITSNFGLRNISSNIGSKNHNGIDIGVSYGTDIYSPVSGVVTNVWKQGRGGLQVSITSPTGERLGFAHLSGTPLKIGAQIQKGQLIGKSGTGGTGPHLHFTLTDKNGFKVDPVKYFNTKTWDMRDHVPEFKSSKK